MTFLPVYVETNKNWVNSIGNVPFIGGYGLLIISLWPAIMTALFFNYLFPIDPWKFGNMVYLGIFLPAYNYWLTLKDITIFIWFVPCWILYLMVAIACLISKLMS